MGTAVEGKKGGFELEKDGFELEKSPAQWILAFKTQRFQEYAFEATANYLIGLMEVFLILVDFANTIHFGSLHFSQQ